MKERDVLKAVLDYLAVKGIYALRLNAGDQFGSYKGKVWRKRGVAPGTADVLALVEDHLNHVPLFIECKRPGGKLSPLQESFKRDIEQRGMAYIIAESSADVEAWLREEGLE